VGQSSGHPERVTLFADGTATDLGGDLAGALEQARAERAWVWIEVLSPSEDEWDHLTSTLALNRLAVEDMREQEQRTKLERYGQHAFMVIHPAHYDDDAEEVRLGELDVYLGRDFLITRRSPQTPPPTEALERVKGSVALAQLGPRGAGYALLDDVVDGYQPVLDGLAGDIDQIDDSLFSRSEDDVAARIYRLSRQVGRFQRVVSPLETLLTAARKSLSGTDPLLLLGEDGGSDPGAAAVDTGGWAEATGAAARPSSPRGDADRGGEHRRRRALLEALLRDVQDHARRIDAHTAEMHSTLSNALSLAMTLASERATEVSLEQSVQAKKVSSWAAIFAAPTVLAGVWGMNFRFMPELEQAWGYPAALATMTAACVGLYAAFKKRNWL
jgi:magnesium transporter